MLEIYLKAESLKFKRSLFRKLVLVIPAALVLISMIFLFIGIGLGGFSSSMVCNWCMPVASLSIVVLCHLVNHKDQKHNYRTLYSLPINLKKTFISKTIMTALNLLAISLIFSALITIITECILSGVSAAIGRAGYYILGYSLLWITLLWQIPFFLFLDQKAGFAGSVILKLICQCAGGTVLFPDPFILVLPIQLACQVYGHIIRSSAKRIISRIRFQTDAESGRKLAAGIDIPACRVRSYNPVFPLV